MNTVLRCSIRCWPIRSDWSWRLTKARPLSLAIAVPVGGVVGGVAGALLGLISNPRLLVLLMAVFAGSAAGAVAGKLPWGDVGEIGGQIAGGLVAAIAWATWLFIGRKKSCRIPPRLAT